MQIWILLFLLTLTSCSAYSSKFICPDAKGLHCEMLHSVDQKIDNGEIEKFYLSNCARCQKEKL